jgi:hypothetical protein
LLGRVSFRLSLLVYSLVLQKNKRQHRLPHYCGRKHNSGIFNLHSFAARKSQSHSSDSHCRDFGWYHVDYALTDHAINGQQRFVIQYMVRYKMAERRKKLIVLLLVLCCVAPFFIVLWCVHAYGVNFPYWDEWNLVESAMIFPSKGISVFWVRHSDHRIFFPQLLMYAALILSKWNVKLLMYLSQFMVLAVAIAYFFYIRRSCRANGIIFQLIAFLPVSILIFSLVQYENILWGFQFGFYMTMATAVLALYFFYLFTEREQIVWIIVADCLGLVSTLSSAQGTMVWIPLLFAAAVFFFSGKQKALSFKLGLLSTIPFALVSWILFFYDYPITSASGSKSIYKLISYFFSNVGSCVFTDLAYSKGFGIFIFVTFLASFIYLCFNRILKKAIFPVMLTIFGFLCSAIISYGRLNIEPPTTSRYTTFSLLIIIGQYLIFLSLKEKKESFIMYFLSAFIALTMLGTAVSEIESVPVCVAIKDCRVIGRQVLLNYDKASESEIQYYVFPDVKALAAPRTYLQKNHYSVFADKK